MKIKIKTREVKYPTENSKQGDKFLCIESHHPGFNQCMKDDRYIKNKVYTLRRCVNIAGEGLIVFLDEVQYFSFFPKKFVLVNDER